MKKAPKFFYPIEEGLLGALSEGPIWLWHRLWHHARQGWYDSENSWWKIGYPDGEWWAVGIFPSHYANVTPREFIGREREVTLGKGKNHVDTRTYEELRFDRLVEAVTDMVCEDFAGMAYRDVIDALGDVQKTFGREGGYEITEDMLNAGYNATRLPDGTPQFGEVGFCLSHAGNIYRAMLAAANPPPAFKEVVEAAREVERVVQRARSFRDNILPFSTLEVILRTLRSFIADGAEK